MAFNDQPKIKLTRVYEKKSKAGNTYFRGRLADAQLLIFRDDQASEESTDPVWNIVLQEAPADTRPAAPRDNGHQEAMRSAQAPPAPDRRAPFDDEIPI